MSRRYRNWFAPLSSPQRSASQKRRHARGAAALSLVSAFLITGIASIGLYYYKHQFNEGRARAADELSAIADLKRQQIVEWRNERLSDARREMKDPFVGDHLLEFLQDPEHTSRTPLQAWLESVRSHNQGLRAVLLDRNMGVQLSSPEEQTRFGPIGAGTARKALESGQTVFSDLHRSRFTGAIHMDLAVPVYRYGADGARSRPAATVPSEPIAVVDVEVDPRLFLYPHIQNWPTPSRTAETLLVRREGNDIVYLNELRHKVGTALSLRLPVTSQDLIAVKAVFGETGIVTGFDYRRKPVLAAICPVSDTPWFLIAKIDQEEIDANLQEKGLVTAGMTVALLISVGMGMGLVARRRKARWLQDQLAIEREHRLILDSAEEGILGLDSEGMHVFVNRAAARMLGGAPDEMIGKASHPIWHRRHAEGPLPAGEDCAIPGTLKAQKSCHSEQEVFWREDGTSFHLEYTRTPCELEDRRCTTVVVFRDITEQKKADEDRVLDRQRMESLLALNRMTDKPLQEITAYAVEESIRLTQSTLGYLAVLDDTERVLTMHYWSTSAHASCRMVDKPIVYQLEQTGLWGEAVRQRKPVVTNDYSAPNPSKRGIPEGHVPITRHLNIPVFDGTRMVAVAGVGNKAADYDDRDVRQLQLFMDGWRHILHQKQARDTLRTSEDRYRVLFQTSQDAIQTLAPPSWKYTSCNPATNAMFGTKDEAEFVSLGPWDLSPEFQPDGRSSAEKAKEMIDTAMALGSHFFEWQHKRIDGDDFPTTVLLTRVELGGQAFLQATVRDITGQKRAEEELHQTVAKVRENHAELVEVNRQLHTEIAERARVQGELAQARKLEAVGHLAAGIAHEINTPAQYVGDNIRFLQEAFADIDELLGGFDRLLEAAKQGTVSDALLAEIDEAVREADPDYLSAEVPRAIGQSLEGIDRVAKIVRAMKEFSHPGNGHKQAINLNQAILSTLTVSRSEWKYVAELVTDLALDLPTVMGFPGELNQVILNLVVNAAHAIADVIGDGAKGKGTLTVRTRRDGDSVEIRIEDTGTGIPETVRDNIFDPFFTTKGVGKGTGQGLSIARSIVVDKHGGSIAFDTEVGRGTTFIIRLPLADQAEQCPAEDREFPEGAT